MLRNKERPVFPLRYLQVKTNKLVYLFALGLTLFLCVTSTAWMMINPTGERTPNQNAIDHQLVELSDTITRTNENVANTSSKLNPGSTQNFSHDEPTIEFRPYKQGVKIQGELVERRTRNTKTYRNDDGTLTTVISTDPFHYFKDGQFQMIDNRIRTVQGNSDEFEVSANEYSVRFPKKSGSPIKFSLDGHEITYRALDSNRVEATTENEKIHYSQAWNSTVLEYIAENGRLKMHLKLLDRDAPDLLPKT